MTGTQKTALTMFYLFANADGKCSKEEESRLSAIAKSFDTTADDLREIKEEVSRVCGVGSDNDANSLKDGGKSRAGSLMSGISSMFNFDYDVNTNLEHGEFEGCSDITSRIIAAFDSYESPRNMYNSFSYWTSNLYGENRLRAIWTMISLGYADTKYSENEKRIVNHLVKKWEIDSAIVSVMIDTAETMLALENKKLWAESTSMSYNDVNRIIADVDADIKRLYHTVEVTISEADIK